MHCLPHNYDNSSESLIECQVSFEKVSESSYCRAVIHMPIHVMHKLCVCQADMWQNYLTQDCCMSTRDCESEACNRTARRVLKHDVWSIMNFNSRCHVRAIGTVVVHQTSIV